MKRLYSGFVILLSILLSAHNLVAQEFVYTDATRLPVYGKICNDTYGPFTRLSSDLESVCRPPLWRLGRDSAGEYVRFASDTGVFNLCWTSTFDTQSTNMSMCAVKGLALYVLDGGEWIYVGTGRPSGKGKENSYKISCNKLAGTMHEYMLFLSLYDGLDKLKIGVPEGYSILSPSTDSPRSGRPVIMYGTSILQGASASHPGMSGSNQLVRMLDRQVINLGFSGNALLDMEIAELMAAYPDPGIFVLDNMPNGTPELILEKQKIFYQVLREAHPGVPVVFVENPNYPGMRFDEGRERFVRSKNEALHRVFDDLVSSGEKNIYLVRAMQMLGDDNVGTIEGTHFTDIGFTSYAGILAPILETLLSKYD